MHASLLNRGFKIGVYRTATLMKKANVTAIAPRNRHYYPHAGKNHIKAKNILERQFYPETINTPRLELPGLLPDLGSKEIVGWAMSKHPNAE